MEKFMKIFINYKLSKIFSSSKRTTNRRLFACKMSRGGNFFFYFIEKNPKIIGNNTPNQQKNALQIKLSSPTLKLLAPTMEDQLLKDPASLRFTRN